MRALVVSAAVLLVPATALAYSDTTSFARDPSEDTAGGGGGIYFTGSPRQHGLDCAACHIGGPEGTALKLSALLDEMEAPLFRRTYEPGRTYQIEVAFDGDLLAPAEGCAGSTNEPCDLNLFALEIVDGQGAPAGAMCPIAPKAGTGAAGAGGRCGACGALRSRGTIAEDDCSVIVADGFDEANAGWRNGVRAYSFFWTAPAEDAGALALHVSAVDGAGRDGPEGEATTYRGDGVVTLTVGLDSPTRRYEEPSSCATSRGGGDVAIVLLALGCAIRAVRTSRGRRSDRSSAGARSRTPPGAEGAPSRAG